VIDVAGVGEFVRASEASDLLAESRVLELKGKRCGPGRVISMDARRDEDLMNRSSS
jgi:hypothetical protein